MEVVILVLLLLIVIGVSNVLHRFLPTVPVSLIQIALGALLAILPLGSKLVLEPELFFLLFISPIIYYDGVHAPRNELWKLRGPILVLALGLVFATVFIVGYVVHWLIPSIPIAASFGLAAILSPTDTLAVSSLSDRIHLPKNLKHVLEGEALINDASSLVSFKFAMAAVVTGYFSFTEASVSFVVISVGGFFLGATIALMVTFIRQLLRNAGLVDETMHMLLQILTPFLIYLIVERIGVSGVLAVVAGGLVHAFEKDRINLTMPGLKNASDPTWSVLIFVLKGLVFIILGLQIPTIYPDFLENTPIDKIISFVLATMIYAMLLLLRYLWTFCYTLFRKWLSRGEQTLRNFRVLTLSTISGVRGPVTLAGAFSIPHFLANGTPFPQRDLIVFLASSVMLISLLTASFTLPLIAKHSEPTDAPQRKKMEQVWQLEIMKAAIRKLQNETTDENENAVKSVIEDYRQMMREIKNQSNYLKIIKCNQKQEMKMHLNALDIERLHIRQKLETGMIEYNLADNYLKVLDNLEKKLLDQMKFGRRMMKTIWVQFRMFITGLFGIKSSLELGFHFTNNDLRTLRIECAQTVVSELSKNKDQKGDIATKIVIDHYRRLLEKLHNFTLGPHRNDIAFVQLRRELHWVAVQAERDAVQRLFEKGTITRDFAAFLRKVIRNRESTLYEIEEMGLQ